MTTSSESSGAERSSGLGRRILLGIALVWAVLFVCGALGELLGIEFLRDLADFKSLFLR